MSRKLKVMWLIKGLGLGGAERLLALSLPYLDRERFEYEVVYLLPWKDALVPEFQKAGIPVFCAQSRSHLDVSLPFRIAELLRRREVDLLHTHLPYAGVVGRLAAKLAGVKAVVYTEHNVPESYKLWTGLSNRLTCRMDSLTIAVSRRVAGSINKMPLFHPKSVRVIYGGVDAERMNAGGRDPGEVRTELGIPPGNSVVGNVANLKPEKGHVYLLQAAKRILNDRPDVTFVIVGGEKKPGMLAQLKELAGGLGIQKNVVFTGAREDAVSIMKTFDVFVMSSLYEGLPVALMEAMSLGKPVVATTAGGISEAVEDGVTGFLVEPRNPDALATKTMALLSDRDGLYEAFSRKARETAERRFSAKVMVSQVENSYEQVVYPRANHKGASEDMTLLRVPQSKEGQPPQHKENRA